MNHLRTYVGVDNSYVLCEKFPDDKEHEGLQEMLEDFIKEKPPLIKFNLNLKQGFYNIIFDIETRSQGSNLDLYLIVEDLYEVK